MEPNLSYQEEAQGTRKYRIKSALKNEKPCLRREEERVTWDVLGSYNDVVTYFRNQNPSLDIHFS